MQDRLIVLDKSNQEIPRSPTSGDILPHLAAFAIDYLYFTSLINSGKPSMSLAPVVAYCRLKILQDISINMQFKSTDSELNQRSCYCRDRCCALYTNTHLGWEIEDAHEQQYCPLLPQDHFVQCKGRNSAHIYLIETPPTSTSLKLPANTPQ